MSLSYGILSSMGGLDRLYTIFQGVDTRTRWRKLRAAIFLVSFWLVMRRPFDCLTWQYVLTSTDSTLFWGLMERFREHASVNLNHQGCARSELFAKGTEASTSRQKSFASSGVVFDDHFGTRIISCGALLLVVRHREVDSKPYEGHHELSIRNINPFASAGSFHRFLVASEEQWREKTSANYLVVRPLNSYGIWAYHLMPRRSADSIHLPENFKREILEDAVRFVRSRETYRTRKIEHCYSRGYLLFGIPGSGKSTCARAIAAELRLGLYSANLSQKELFENGMLNRAVANVKTPAVVLFEDIDCAGLSNRESGDTMEGNNRLGCMLDAIDHLAREPGCIIIMTTNRPGQLDPALIRSGRVDVSFEFKAADGNQIQSLFNNIYDDCQSDRDFAATRRQVCESALKLRYTVADCESLFVKHIDDPKAVAATLDRLCGSLKSPKEWWKF